MLNKRLHTPLEDFGNDIQQQNKYIELYLIFSRKLEKKEYRAAVFLNIKQLFDKV